VSTVPNVIGALYPAGLRESERMVVNAAEHAQLQDTVHTLTEHNVTLLAQVSAQRATIREQRDALALKQDEIDALHTRLRLLEAGHV
jgi:hypothetical protein